MSGSARSSDHREDLVIDIHELGRSPGAVKTLQRVIPAPDDLGIAMIKVAEGSDIDLDLQLTSVGEGILVSGVASVVLEGECSRCLKELHQDGDFDINELYFYPGKGEEDDFEVVDEQINLEPVLRESIVLGLPFNPVCRDDCAGLCVECGANLNEHPGHQHEAKLDPRWDKLADLKLDLDQ